MIPLELIRSVNDTQFCINSQSDLGRCYLVDIQRLICNCLDFPRVQICKHLCAVKIWYPFIPPADDLTQDLQRSSSISYQLAATSSSLSGTGCHLLHQSQYQLSLWVPCQIRIPSAQIKISGRQQWYDWYLPSLRNFEFYCFFTLFINLHISELSVLWPTFPHLGQPSPVSLYLLYHFP